MHVSAVLLVLIRLSGKRAVKEASAFDFTMALVLGDLIDDVLWAEVAAAQFDHDQATASALLRTERAGPLRVRVSLVRRSGLWRISGWEQ